MTTQRDPARPGAVPGGGQGETRMKTIVEILVNGKVKMTLPVEVRPDGTLWGPSTNGPTPAINGFLLEKNGISRDEFKRQSNNGKFSPEVLACCMHLGENPGGRLVRDKSTADTEAERSITPANRERREIDRMFAAAERVDRSEDDEEYRRKRFAAEGRLDAWKIKFPSEAAAERADAIRARAARRRELAAGAMLYDCDGSLSQSDQEERRDTMLAEAAALDAEANAISPRKAGV